MYESISITLKRRGARVVNEKQLKGISMNTKTFEGLY